MSNCFLLVTTNKRKKLIKKLNKVLFIVTKGLEWYEFGWARQNFIFGRIKYIKSIYSTDSINLFDYVSVKASTNNLKDDVNFKHIVEHALSCTLERVDKDVSNMGGLRFGTVDESCLIKATRREADCVWLDQPLGRAKSGSTGRAGVARSSNRSSNVCRTSQ